MVGVLFGRGTASAQERGQDAGPPAEPSPEHAPAAEPAPPEPSSSPAPSTPPVSPEAPLRNEVTALRDEVRALRAQVEELRAPPPPPPAPPANGPPPPEKAPPPPATARPLGSEAFWPWVLPPDGVTLGGYLQAQYESHEDSQDQLFQGGAPMNQDRFLIRRARASFVGEWPY